MKTVDLTLSEQESIEGGIIPFIIIGAAALLASCGNSQKNSNASGSYSVNVNCSNCTIIIDQCDSTVNVIQK